MMACDPLIPKDIKHVENVTNTNVATSKHLKISSINTHKFEVAPHEIEVVFGTSRSLLSVQKAVI